MSSTTTYQAKPVTWANVANLSIFCGRGWIEYVLFGLTALLVRLPLALTYGLDWDETLSAHTTFRMIREERWLPYQSGQNYMGTLQELLNALSIEVFGRHLVVFRLPTLLIAATCVALAVAIVNRVAGRTHARLVGLLLVCMNSAFGFYTYRSMPDYPIGWLLALLLIPLTICCRQRRSMVCWLSLGFVGGVGLQVFAIVGIQFAVCIAFLIATSPYARRLKEAWLTPSARWRLLVAGGLVSTAALAAAPVVYRTLTRSATYSPSTTALGLVGLAAILTGLATSALLSVVPPTRREALAAVMILGLAAAIPAIAGFWHRVAVQPELVEAGVTPWSAGTYALRHAHEWPSQISLFFGHVIPDMVVGQRTSYTLTDAVGVPFTPLAALVLALTFAGILGLVRPLADLVQSSRGEIWLLALPPFLLTAAMLPSWRLNGDGSLRYYLIYLPGVFLLVSILLTRVLSKRSVQAVVAAYALYSLFDLALFSPSCPPDPAAQEVAQLASQEGVDAVLTCGELSKELVWETRGRIIIADPTQLPANWWYPRRKELLGCKRFAVIGIDGESLARGLDWMIDRYELVRAFPNGLAVYQKK